MKSMEDYIHMEKEIYQHILKNQDSILASIMNIDKNRLKVYESVVIFATGSSSNAAFAAQPYMAKCLEMPVTIEEPSVAANYMLYIKPNTLYLAISQGGHSYSTIHMVREIEKQDGTVFTLTSDFTSPIAKEANNTIGLGMAVEEMPYVTAGYSATILVLMLLAIKIAIRTRKMSKEAGQKEYMMMQVISEQLPNVITQSEKWINCQLNEWMNLERILFIGYGATYGVAREGETKVTETVRITAFGKELEEYMHGPYIGLMKQDQLIFIEPHGKLETRANRLKTFLSDHVDAVYTIYADQHEAQKEQDLALEMKGVDELFAPLFMTIPIHLLSYKLSQQKGIDLEVSAYPDFDKITGSKI